MDIKQEVLNYIENINPIPGTSEEEKLAVKYLDAGILDSMGIVSMIMDFEEKFSIQFSPDHLQSDEFATVGGLISIVEQLKASES